MLKHTREAIDRGKAAHAEWDEQRDAWAAANPERKALLDRVLAGDLPEDAFADVPVFPAGKAVSTRVASGKVINGIAKRVPEFWGGSADLAESNNTAIEGADSFLPPRARHRDVEGEPLRPRAALRHPASTRWGTSSTGSCCTGTRASSAPRS